MSLPFASYWPSAPATARHSTARPTLERLHDRVALRRLAEVTASIG